MGYPIPHPAIAPVYASTTPKITIFVVWPPNCGRKQAFWAQTTPKPRISGLEGEDWMSEGQTIRGRKAAQPAPPHLIWLLRNHLKYPPPGNWVPYRVGEFGGRNGSHFRTPYQCGVGARHGPGLGSPFP